MIYAVGYTKGGVGKSTIAVHLAAYLARSGSALLIDGDPQRTAVDWAGWRAEANIEPSPVTISLLGKAIHDQGEQVQKNYDNTVIDVGGKDGPGVRNALLLADRLLLPINATGFDAAMLREFLDVIEEAQAFNSKLEVRAIVNKLHPGRKDTMIRDFLTERGVKTFNQVIHQRLAFQDATGEGLTVEEHKPRNAAATHEMKKLYEEITAWS